MTPAVLDPLAQAPSSGVTLHPASSEPASTSTPKGAHSNFRLIVCGKFAGSGL